MDAVTYVRVQSIFYDVFTVFPYKAAHSVFGRRFLACSRVVRACSCGTAVSFVGSRGPVLEVTFKGNTPLLPEVPCVGQTNNICDKENWEREPGVVAMTGHSTPAFGGVPNSSDILAKPDKSFAVLGDARRWNSNLNPIELERSFPTPDRPCLDDSEEVKLSGQEIEALESTLELSIVFTDLEVSEVARLS